MDAGDIMVSLLILLPLAGSVLLLAVGRRLPEPWAGLLGTLTVGAGFVLAAVAGWDFLAGTGHATHVPWFDWLGPLGVRAGLLWDPLSALMALVVTGVGSLIHLYSIGYMKGDPRFGRFFAYMNLFVASMLILVLADGFALLFVGWELVGLCSYLLISLLVREARGRRRREEGLRRQPGGRRRVPGGADAGVCRLRLAELRGGAGPGLR